MKSLAELLLDLGFRLSGSDLLPPNGSIEKLVQRGFVFHHGHRPANVSSAVDCLVYSAAIPPENPERVVAAHRGLPQLSYTQMVAQLIRPSTGVCVAGTHGKSTTTAMTARILETAGRLSAAVVGAELCQWNRGGWSGSGDLFVVESCEFQRSFHDFTPRYAAILSIEHDHFDCYPDFASLEGAFREFASRTTNDGILLANGDCPVSRAVSLNAQTGARRVSFAIFNSADWTAINMESTAEGSRFTLSNHGVEQIDIKLSLHGQHNIANAVAAAALCAEIGVSCETIRDSLASFQGIRRRLEFVGDVRQATFVDDYAHHPTAVRATLKALRNAVGQRRILCIFQPHQILRTTALMDDFAASFVDANEVWLAPVFAARESVGDEPLLVSAELANRVLSLGIPSRSFNSLDQIVTTLDDAIRPEDVVVTMGAGDIDRIYYEFTRRVQ